MCSTELIFRITAVAAGIDKEKRPSMSLDVPVVLLSTTIFAKGMGNPVSASLIRPSNRPFWASRDRGMKQKKMHLKKCCMWKRR
jgi:hypothetical protein